MKAELWKAERRKAETLKSDDLKAGPLKAEPQRRSVWLVVIPVFVAILLNPAACSVVRGSVSARRVIAVHSVHTEVVVII